MIFRSLLSGEVYGGDTYDNVVIEMATRRQPNHDPAVYILECAERAIVWNGSVLDTFTAERFIKSMVAHQFLIQLPYDLGLTLPDISDQAAYDKSSTI